MLVFAGLLFYNYLTVELVPIMENVFERFPGLVDFVKGEKGDKSTEHRSEFLANALDIIYEHPFTGIGLDCFKGYNVSYSHNNYAEIFVGIGIMGVIVYYAGFIELLRKIFILKLPLYNICIMVIILRLLLDFAIVSYYLRTVIIVFVALEAFIDKTLEKTSCENTSC